MTVSVQVAPALKSLLQISISRRDIGILPLLFVLPFMFYPKVVGGDTQPWILGAAILAFFTFRTDQFIQKRDLSLVVLAVLCVAAYATRTQSMFGLLRNAYTYVAFVVLWLVCARERGDYFPSAIRYTTLIWFSAGVYQFVVVKLGYAIEMGRFMPGRSGVPSLAAEASYYGSLSMVHLMYLLSEKNRRNRIFIACAGASVVLSGSLLAMVLLAFPLRKLSPAVRVVAAIALASFVVGDYYLSSAGLAARLRDITSMGASVQSFVLDASLNMRVGQVYFTLWEHLRSSLLFIGPIDFMAQYNQFAADSGIFLAVGSDYILPAAGEMIYGGGLVALCMLFVVFRRAVGNARGLVAKLERIAFIGACMLNPISLSNIFLIMYMQKQE
jgi:hypothetical protein